jgi:hypothetical protein
VTVRQTPLFGIGNKARSLNVSSQDRLNLYVEVNDDAEKHVLTYYPTPGLSSFVNFGAFPSRGSYELGGFIYTVNRNKLWRIANDGSTTDMGTLLTTEGRVDMSDNGIELIVVDGANGYILTLASSVFAQIADPDFPGADTVTFLNQRFIVNEPGTARFYCSALLNGASWDALDFATAESDPDNLVRVIAESGQLTLLGAKTCEIWGDSGAADFPYSKVGGSAVEWGLVARWSLAKYMNSLAFLGRNRLGQVQVCLMSGASVQPISNPQIEVEFTSYGDTSNATGFAYMVNGHPFYQINFPTPGKSWLYDGQSRSWSRLESSGGLHRVQYAVKLLGSIYGADYETGNLYKIDPDEYTDNGQTIVREFISRHQNSGNFTRLSELWIEMESGVGLQSGQGTNPQVILQVSRDGGHTYGNELMASFGRVGQYKARANWHRLGRARDWTFRFRVTDPVKTVFVAAWAEISQ